MPSAKNARHNEITDILVLSDLRITEVKGCAFALPTFQPDFPAICFLEFFAKYQPYARALLGFGSIGDIKLMR
jgi:hypothetical protein